MTLYVALSIDIKPWFTLIDHHETITRYLTRGETHSSCAKGLFIIAMTNTQGSLSFHSAL